jgi:hypothetical protein
MTNEPLYKNNRLSVIYNPNAPAGDEHILSVTPKAGGEDRWYALPRGVMAELSRGDNVSLANKLDNLDRTILFGLDQEGIDMGDVLTALQGAYAEEERRISNFSLDLQNPTEDSDFP